MARKAQIEQAGRPGRKPSRNADHTAALRAITQELPRPSLDELTRELLRRAGVRVSTVTVRTAPRETGIERLKPLRRAGVRAAVRGAMPARRTCAPWLHGSASPRRWLQRHEHRLDRCRVGAAGRPVRARRAVRRAARCERRQRVTPAATRSARAVRGGGCPRPCRLGRRPTSPSAAGRLPVCSRPCTTGCAINGVTAWAGLPIRPP